jgi:ABC-2 type transport system ATP-binding protein
MSFPAESAIDVSGLTKLFGTVVAISDVAFDVQRGEIFGLIGPDGAGKTTILRVLSGVMAADGGTVVVDGVDVISRPDDVRPRISYMPQRFGLYEDLTVDENIRFYADVFEIPRSLREQRAARLLAASGMVEFRKRLAGELSGGMKQKLGLTCSLVHAPRIVLLDEPTTGVDPVSRREFWQILYSLRAECVTIVISTAYFDEAERCDRLALLHTGVVRYCESPGALRARMPGALLEIPTSAARAARDAIAGQPGVYSALMVGDGVHVHVDEAERRRTELDDALTAKAVPHGEIHEVTPNVEDLFVALLAPGAKAT